MGGTTLKACTGPFEMRAAQGCCGAAQAFKTEQKRTFYGFTDLMGQRGGEGEGFTRIPESNYRRTVCETRLCAHANSPIGSAPVGWFLAVFGVLELQLQLLQV